MSKCVLVCRYQVGGVDIAATQRAEADSRVEPKKLKHKLNKRSLGMRISSLSSHKTLEFTCVYIYIIHIYI